MDSKNIVDHFGDLPDPYEDNRRHSLIDIIVICASICGAEKWDDIEAFGRAKEAWLRRFLTLPMSALRIRRVRSRPEVAADSRTVSGGVIWTHG